MDKINNEEKLHKYESAASIVNSVTKQKQRKVSASRRELIRF